MVDCLSLFHCVFSLEGKMASMFSDEESLLIFLSIPEHDGSFPLIAFKIIFHVFDYDISKYGLEFILLESGGTF